MSSRVQQANPAITRPWACTFDVQRGGVSIFADEVKPTFFLPFFQGVGFICVDFTIPAGVPGTGAWQFFGDALFAFDNQSVGTAQDAAHTLAPAWLSGGALVTSLAINAGSVVSFRGQVR